MEKEYLMSFSSFYKAAYAKDVLETHGLRSSLRKLPPQIAHSCSTGIYLRIDSIDRVQQVLKDQEIVYRGCYEIQRIGGEKVYIRV
ncbi:MAG: DUF3343 domain-containing protein [Firmicutes bacterium]|nr:DUF3343 domain-containing protein [Bacillota bacterium]